MPNALAEEDDDVSPSAHSLSLFFVVFVIEGESLFQVGGAFSTQFDGEKKNEMHEIRWRTSL